MDLTKIKAALPYLKKAVAYLTGATAAVTAVIQGLDGNFDGMWTSLGIAGAAFGLNLPAHVQVNAASK